MRTGTEPEEEPGSSEGWPTREELRERLDRYTDVPLALASLALLLLALIEIGGDVGEPWRGRLATLGWILWAFFLTEFVVKFALAPDKRRYLRRNWLDALTVLVPFLKFLRLARVLRATRALPVFRLLIFGGRGSSAALVILKRRRLGQLAIISALVVFIGAALVFILEAGTAQSQIEDFGDALWWASTTTTTVGSGIEPVTTGGRIVAFSLMLYAVGIFSYFIASISSVLVGLDSQQDKPAEAGEYEDSKAPGKGPRLEKHEVEALRSILERSDGSGGS
jgi:voltage-gated potassium channel